MAQRLRLGSGADVLDAWVGAAGLADVTAVASALFSIVDRAVYRLYPVVEDAQVARELVIVVRDDLAIRIRLDDVDTFGIVFIGTPRAAIDLRKVSTSESSAGGG